MGDKPFWKAERVIAVGMGGIGTAHIFMLSRMMSRVARAPKELIIVDGDTYSERNLDRQQVLESDVGQQKARVWAKALAAEFKNLAVSAKTHYVTDKNIKDFDPEKSIFMLGLDNNPSRKLFSVFADRAKNTAVICGGNEKVDGSVLLYVRENGQKLTPSLTDFHPEIEKPKGKNPGELSCAELAKLKGGHQIMNANATAGMVMMNMFRILVEGDPEASDLAKLDHPAGTKCVLCKQPQDEFRFEDHEESPICPECRVHECGGCGRRILVDVSTDDELRGLCVRCALAWQAEVYFDIRKNATRSRARFIADRDVIKKAVEKPKEEVDQKKVVTKKVTRKSKAAVPVLEAAPPVEHLVEVQAAIAPPPAVDVAPEANGPAEEVVGEGLAGDIQQ